MNAPASARTAPPAPAGVEVSLPDLPRRDPERRCLGGAVPWSPSNAFHISRLDCFLPMRAGVTLRLILAGAMESGARLSNGRLVDRSSDAIEFILERAGDQIGVDALGGYPGKHVTAPAARDREFPHETKHLNPAWDIKKGFAESRSAPR